MDIGYSTIGDAVPGPYVPRKAVYHRPVLDYPGAYVAWSYRARCDSALLELSTFTTAQVDQARSFGMKVFLWSGIDSWNPRAWRTTYQRMIDRVWGLSLDGFIADVEDWNRGPYVADPWNETPASERDALATALANAAERTSVGFTSFPTMPIAQLVSSASRRVWGSPQLYGIRRGAGPDGRDLALPAESVIPSADGWARRFGPPLAPSLALSWVRTDAEQRAYLNAMSRFYGGLFWTVRVPTGDQLRALTEWTPRGSHGQGSEGVITPWPVPAPAPAPVPEQRNLAPDGSAAAIFLLMGGAAAIWAATRK